MLPSNWHFASKQTSTCFQAKQRILGSNSPLAWKQTGTPLKVDKLGRPSRQSRSTEIAKGVGGPQDGWGSFQPLKRRRQWMEPASSMDGQASVNGLSSATQWMERCDSMDGTSHFNGLTIARPSPATPLPTVREKWEIWQGRNTRMGLAERGGFRRRNGGIPSIEDLP